MLEIPPVLTPHTGTSHLVQLFDSDETLASGIADFFAVGLLRKDTMLAVMDRQRWNAVVMRLSARGLAVDEALWSGHLSVRDAQDTLNAFMVRDRPDPRLFAASVGAMVSRLAALGRPLRVYGEMVDVLAANGEYKAAFELEQLWNELGTRHAFTLFCGYNSAHFGDPRSAGALRTICASHSEVRSNPADVLGSFLLRAHRAG
jgi:hypothetical protein